MIVTNEIAPVKTVDAAIMAIISDNPIKVALAKEKTALQGWFVGQAMKVTEGKIDADVVREKVEIAFMRQ